MFKLQPMYKVITPRKPMHIRLFLVQHFMVGPVRKRKIGKRGGKFSYLCRQIFFKERGGSVHCLKYSLKFQDLNSSNYHDKTFFNTNFTTPLPCLAYAHLPHPGKKFAQRKDENALALLELFLYGSTIYYVNSVYYYCLIL